MAEVTLTSVTKKSGDFVAADAIDFKVEEGWFTVLVGMRENDHLVDGRWPGRGDERRDTHRGPRGQLRVSEGPRHRDGLPELHPVHGRVQQYGIWPQATKGPKAGDQEAGPRYGGA